MQTAKIIVYLIDGKQLEFEALETRSNTGYGRDKYVSIFSIRDGERIDFAHIDVRYVSNYDFRMFLWDEMIANYGKNLKKISFEILDESEDK